MSQLTIYKAIRSLISIVGILFLITTEAKGGSEWQANSLVHSKTLQDFKRRNAEVQTYEEFKETCQFELKLEEIPAHCFAYLKHAEKVEPDGKNEIGFNWTQIEQICKSRGAASRSVAGLINKSDVPNLSSSCRAEILKRIEILNYQSLEDGVLGIEAKE